MENQDNLNKINCEYYAPMGKPGSLVIKAPVILSKLKISIPIYTKINLKENYINVIDKNNKILLDTLKIRGENELVIKGNISKTLKYFSNKYSINSLKTFNMNIPIKEKVNINFNQAPINSNINLKLYYQKSSQPIYCELECIKIAKDIITKINNTYVNKFGIYLYLSLIQVQDVFISEPEGNAFILRENSKYFVLDESDFEKENYLIGFNPQKGLIAKKQK
ncbi:hypothetical protein ACNULB_08845 [Clostridium perfringens]|uniref:hypothetical protein n=1 Tax=Clostridium perfringens TaxID=1502 RepID=UPI003AFFBFD6